jgi:hypothetical protein
MKPIAIFYHCLFYHGTPPEVRPIAFNIIQEQMAMLQKSGLESAASQIHVGINGGEESKDLAKLILPSKARPVFHGLQSHAENLTIVEIEKWVRDHPDCYVLYFHSKGCTHEPGPVLDMRSRWRRCMMIHLVWDWQRCVADLDKGYESVGCHWMEPPKTPPTQYIWAGNFWWAKSIFLRTLPSIYERQRIKDSGIGNVESRYEAEVWIGNGKRPPSHRDYHPNWDPTKTGECTQ